MNAKLKLKIEAEIDAIIARIDSLPCTNANVRLHCQLAAKLVRLQTQIGS